MKNSSKNKKHFSLSLIGLGLLGACAHHPDVRPGDGVHRVVIKTDDEEQGARAAIAQARSFCKESKKHPVFVEENKQYQGDMKEGDYNRAKRVSKVAQGVGSALWVLGDGKASTIGGAVGVGGAVANNVLGKGYVVDMKFRCE